MDVTIKNIKINYGEIYHEFSLMRLISNYEVEAIISKDETEMESSFKFDSLELANPSISDFENAIKKFIGEIHNNEN